MRLSRMNLGLLVILFASALLVNCTMFGTKPTDVSDQEYYLYVFESAYNAQFKDTMAMAKMPNLTDTQKQVVKKKKEVLTQARPLITSYGAIVMAGGIPSPAQEQEIFNLLNSIGAQLERRK